MNILVLAEYIRRQAWSPSAWAVDVARGLAGRGHDVLIACDGLEDPGLLDGLAVRIRRPLRTHRSADPVRFQRWAEAIRREERHRASISLTPWCAGDLWIRLDAQRAGAILRSISTRNPLSFALEIAHRPWLIAGWLAEARALRRAGRARRLHIDARPEEDEAHALLHASRLIRPEEPELARWRAEVRAVLGLGDSRPVLLLSAVDVDHAALDAFLRALAQRPDHRAVLLAAGRRAWTVAEAAARAGCRPGVVRHLGTTGRIELALAACDAAVIPWPDRGGSAGARFLADALVMGRPVLAHRGTPGADLLEPAHFGTAPLGLLAEAATAEGWVAVLDAALADGWLPKAARAARDAGPALSMTALIARLERHLAAR